MSKTEYVQLGDAQVGYRDSGGGAPLVLVHGTGGDGEANWGEVIRHLPGRRILRPDYAGSGLTTDLSGRLTLDRLAGQVLATADHAGVETFDLVGFSLGAAVAVRLASRHPDRVRHLVSLGGFVTGMDPRSRLQFDHWIDLVARDREAGVLVVTTRSYAAAATCRGRTPPIRASASASRSRASGDGSRGRRAPTAAPSSHW